MYSCNGNINNISKINYDGSKGSNPLSPVKHTTSCLLQDVFITLWLFIPRKWFQNHFIEGSYSYRMVLEPLPGDKWLQSYEHILQQARCNGFWSYHILYMKRHNGFDLTYVVYVVHYMSTFATLPLKKMSYLCHFGTLK